MEKFVAIIRSPSVMLMRIEWATLPPHLESEKLIWGIFYGEIWLKEIFIFFFSGNWSTFFIAVSVLTLNANGPYKQHPTLITGFMSDFCPRLWTSDLTVNSMLLAFSVLTVICWLLPYCVTPGSQILVIAHQQGKWHLFCRGLWALGTIIGFTHTFRHRDSRHHALYVQKGGSSHSTIQWAF